ncbi:MAG: 3-deoxy-7-phosphoheptulonate synthase [Gammaproteobacteria bacterium]|nr:3-deoxy-7-phosphoheptulonate synthase [Gammaproteobacteria bacterium]
MATTEAYNPETDRNNPADNERIVKVSRIPPPSHLLEFFPIDKRLANWIVESRKKISDIIAGKSPRLLVVVGPCSIHDTHAAIEYAHQLNSVKPQLTDYLEIVMRVYFEKPRTTVGWKGLINDPNLDQSFRIAEGLRKARALLLEINEMGLPTGSEFLDVITPQYIGDLISWGAIGARTTESQVHRELASGLSAPVGFKNGTDGNIQIAIDGILAAKQKHHFLSVDKNGQVAIVESRGNLDCHIILRGGKNFTNYDANSIQSVCKQLEISGLSQFLMVDCSHANSHKRYQEQVSVAESLARQIQDGNQSICGIMLESNLQEGNQPFNPGKDDPLKLTYGQSITDACLGWESTQEVLMRLAEAVKHRRFKTL